MIRFEEDSRGLVLEYEVEFNDPEWVSKRLKQDGLDGEVNVCCGFTFQAADLLKSSPKRGTDNSNVGVLRFRFAAKDAGNSRIPGRDLWVRSRRADRDPRHPSGLECKTFVAERDIEVFPRIEKVMTGPGEIVVGGARMPRWRHLPQSAAGRISHPPSLLTIAAITRPLSKLVSRFECNQIAELGRLHD